jgi:hypothetical protein
MHLAFGIGSRWAMPSGPFGPRKLLRETAIMHRLWRVETYATMRASLAFRHKFGAFTLVSLITRLAMLYAIPGQADNFLMASCSRARCCRISRPGSAGHLTVRTPTRAAGPGSSALAGA